MEEVKGGMKKEEKMMDYIEKEKKVKRGKMKLIIKNGIGK